MLSLPQRKSLFIHGYKQTLLNIFLEYLVLLRMLVIFWPVSLRELRWLFGCASSRQRFFVIKMFLNVWYATETTEIQKSTFYHSYHYLQGSPAIAHSRSIVEVTSQKGPFGNVSQPLRCQCRPACIPLWFERSAGWKTFPLSPRCLALLPFHHCPVGAQ